MTEVLFKLYWELNSLIEYKKITLRIENKTTA